MLTLGYNNWLQKIMLHVTDYNMNMAEHRLFRTMACVI